MSQGEIGSGLKDALKVASQRVVGRVGKTDGYNGDPAIRIPLPDPLQKIEGPLKSVGAGGMLADLQTRMNRAAEQAAPKALNIFTGAVSKMSITDARTILDGPKDAATQYFKRTTTSELTTSFRPIVDSSLSSVGAVSTFKSVQGRAATDSLRGPGGAELQPHRFHRRQGARRAVPLHGGGGGGDPHQPGGAHHRSSEEGVRLIYLRIARRQRCARSGDYTHTWMT